jgi:hypothetical protein
MHFLWLFAELVLEGWAAVEHGVDFQLTRKLFVGAIEGPDRDFGFVVVGGEARLLMALEKPG